MNTIQNDIVDYIRAELGLETVSEEEAQERFPNFLWPAEWITVGIERTDAGDFLVRFDPKSRLAMVTIDGFAKRAVRVVYENSTLHANWECAKHGLPLSRARAAVQDEPAE